MNTYVCALIVQCRNLFWNNHYVKKWNLLRRRDCVNFHYSSCASFGERILTLCSHATDALVPPHPFSLSNRRSYA